MNINLGYFFSSNTFPWRLSGIDRPCYGPAHLYVCRILAPFAGQDAGFLRGNPMLSEMARFSDNLIIEDIHRHFTRLKEDHNPYHPEPLDRQIIYYLSNSREFRDELHKRLIKEHLAGNLIPAEAIYSYESESQYVRN